MRFAKCERRKNTKFVVPFSSGMSHFRKQNECSGVDSTCIYPFHTLALAFLTVCWNGRCPCHREDLLGHHHMDEPDESLHGVRQKAAADGAGAGQALRIRPKQASEPTRSPSQKGELHHLQRAHGPHPWHFGVATRCHWYALVLHVSPYTLHFSPAKKYFVLGGQHTVAALQELATERLKSSLPVLDWQTFVFADILEPGTPLPVRRQISGDHQYSQPQVSHLGLSRWAQALLSAEPEGTLEDKVKFATRSTGFKRFPDSVCAL